MMDSFFKQRVKCFSPKPVMMNKIQILYFGKHKEILDTVVRLINNNENWSGKGVEHAEEVIEHLHQSACDILLLGCGIEEASETLLRNFIQEKYPNIKIIQHYGGGSGLLANEIMEALTSASSSDQ